MVDRVQGWKRLLESGLSAFRAGAVRGMTVVTLGSLCGGATFADDAVYSNNARFRIPYQLDAAEIQRLKAAEIQLHVTTDAGRRWRHVDSVPPVDGKFTFEATQDGEYWFSVRTVGEDGRQHPPGPLTAGLKVHVDTVQPTLTLRLGAEGSGQVGLEWNAADDHLDVESLVLEYRQSDADAWETIQVVPTEAGQTSWSVPAGGTIAVRGRVNDLAGNQISQQSELVVAGVATPQTPAAPTARSPIDHSPIDHSPIDHSPIASVQPPIERRVAADPFLPSPAADRSATTSLPVISPNAGNYNHLVSQQATEQSAGQQPWWSELPGQSATPQTPSQPAATSAVRRVNSTSFQIGYALEDVGPSGVSSVELYLTEDQGARWYHYGIDEDRTSPFPVTVPGDGTYGFAIRVRSGAGLSQKPPQPGDAADVTIAVDRQPPQVTLLPLKQGAGRQPNQVLIEWSTVDEQLSERPISLSYSANPRGPWIPISGQEANTGQYLWTYGPNAPQQVYIRVEARDAAGNVARVESREPLMIDLSRPTARILDVESASALH